jgi:hypothetical protein
MSELWKERQEVVKGLREENAVARAKRSDAQQLGTLDHRLGQGVGAVRERARLLGSIEKAKTR